MSVRDSDRPDLDDESDRASKVADLVGRAQSGSRSSYAELVHRFHGRLYNFLLRRTGSAEDAEDLTQDAFVRAWQRLDRYEERWEFSTWLFTIAARLAITHHRRRRPTTSLTLTDVRVTGPCDDPGHTVAEREQGRELWRLADAHLGDTARAALWLHYAEDLSPRDIARVLNRSQVSVRVMLHRARAVLATHMPADGAAETHTRQQHAVQLGKPLTGGI